LIFVGHSVVSSNHSFHVTGRNLHQQPSRVQLTPHPKQWMKSKAWLGYNRRCVVNVATMAGTPRSKAN